MYKFISIFFLVPVLVLGKSNKEGDFFNEGKVKIDLSDSILANIVLRRADSDHSLSGTLIMENLTSNNFEELKVIQRSSHNIVVSMNNTEHLRLSPRNVILINFEAGLRNNNDGWVDFYILISKNETNPTVLAKRINVISADGNRMFLNDESYADYIKEKIIKEYRTYHQSRDSNFIFSENDMKEARPFLIDIKDSELISKFNKRYSDRYPNIEGKYRFLKTLISNDKRLPISQKLLEEFKSQGFDTSRLVGK